jgi:DNA-binding NarL/FixJ family response regulator
VPDQPLRIVLADDHYLVREGTRQLLELGGEVEVIASCADVEQLLDATARLRPDVVVTDIRMPPGHGTEGIDAARQLRALDPPPGVVILSAHADARYALALFRDGAAGLAYLLKDRVGERAQLLHAIREVASGRSVVDAVVVEALVDRRPSGPGSAFGDLTPRERDVMNRMAQGRTNRAVATELGITVSAVEKYVNAIFAKLGLAEQADVHRRVAAVLAWLAHGAA